MYDESFVELSPRALKGFVAGAVLLIVIVLAWLSLKQIFRKNPYGPEIEISNFDQYFSDTPDDQRDIIFNNLYTTAANNTSKDIPSKGASIRPDTAELNYDENTKIFSGKFIVDLEALRQSYRVQFEWSKQKNNTKLSGYRVLTTCVNQDERIYPEFICTDMITEDNKFIKNITKQYPIMSDLPISIDYYENNSGQYTRYDIVGELTFNTDGSANYRIVISDYTGNNYDTALSKIRSLGHKPEDYNIEYRDLSGGGRAF